MGQESSSVRAVARELRRLATRLERGDFDMAEISQMCPVQRDAQGHASVLPVLIVHMVAWQGAAGEGANANTG